MVGDRNIKSRAAAGLFAVLNGKGNSNGYIDLANASTGLDTKLENPSIISKAINNFTLPDDVKNKDLNHYAMRFNGASELIDDTYGRSKVDNILSIAEANGSISDDYRKIKTAESISSISSASLGVAPSNDNLFMSAAF